MAIGQSDGSIILNTKVDTSGINKGFSSIEGGAKKMASTVGKAFLAISAAATAAIASIVKASVQAYAENEQLVGGVETLFKTSSKKVIEYARQAYKTTGMSANEYMANVTSFSASLLSSLGGDTDKAAEVANAALVSISDNANKMGTDMGSVTLAFQGFAKQQYMLLDNLKIGYGGTRGEMERLLKDAQAITGVKYDINNLADVYTAIGVIQEKLGIAGTTAKEAATTISGAGAMTKAAWQNVLVAISGGSDLDVAIENLVESVSVYFENIVPVVERALGGVGSLVEKVAPLLVQTVAKSLIKAIPSLLSAVYQMIIGLSKGIYQGIIDLFTGGAKETFSEQSESIEKSVENQKELTKAVEETNDAVKKTTAGFDTVQILSGGIAEDMSVGDVVSEIGVAGGLSEYIEIEETEKQLSQFEISLRRVFSSISSYIQSAWNSKPVQAFWSAATSYGKTGLIAIQNIGATIWENLKITWKNIEGNFGEMTSNMIVLWVTFWQDFQGGIDKWGRPLIDNISGVFNSIWTNAVYPYIKFIAESWVDLARILKDEWEEYGWPLIDNIGEFSRNVVELFQKIYDNILDPIIKPLLETMNSLWDEHISSMIEKAVEFVMKLSNGAREIYNEFIHPVVMWLIDFLAPVWAWISTYIVGVFDSVITFVSDAASALFDILNGMIDFIVGVFAGDWERAWEGVKTIFKSVFDGLVAILKLPINLIIDAINSLIAGLNKVSFDLPNWGVLGDWAGKSFGINIPQIPKLAQGAVIPPNREFLAVLGDNKRENEIVSPVSTMKQAFMEAMVEMGGMGQTTKEEHYYLNETELMSIMYRLVRGGERLKGESLVNGGAY